jgi:hypothetical protein
MAVEYLYNKKDTCQHRVDDRDSYTDGIVYVCNCGQAFEVCDLMNSIDEADRRAGAAERLLVDKSDTIFRSSRWKDEKKEKLGYDRNASFDVVFQDLIDLLGGWEQARRKCLGLPDTRRR